MSEKQIAELRQKLEERFTKGGVIVSNSPVTMRPIYDSLWCLKERHKINAKKYGRI